MTIMTDLKKGIIALIWELFPHLKKLKPGGVKNG